MKIEFVSNNEQAIGRIISILLYKLAVADSKDVVDISKELRYWIHQRGNEVKGCKWKR